MRVIFETNQGIEFEIDSTVQDAEKVVAGINFSRANANTMEMNDNNGGKVIIKTTDITSIKFVY